MDFAPKLGARVISEAPTGDAKNPGSWAEQWTVSACQQEFLYRVAFTPEGRGTAYAIRLIDPAAPSHDSVPKPEVEQNASLRYTCPGQDSNLHGVAPKGF